MGEPVAEEPGRRGSSISLEEIGNVEQSSIVISVTSLSARNYLETTTTKVKNVNVICHESELFSG